MKKIAIAALNCNPENKVAPLFYKCRMFCIYSPEANRMDYFENPWFNKENLMTIELVNWLREKGVTETYGFKYRPETQEELEKSGISANLLESDKLSVEEVVEIINKR